MTDAYYPGQDAAVVPADGAARHAVRAEDQAALTALLDKHAKGTS